MKSQFMQLQSDGTISIESIDWTARLERLNERRDPDGIESMSEQERAMWLESQLSAVGAETVSLDADISAIYQLGSVAASLEQLADTVVDMMETNNADPANIARMAALASTISAPADATPIRLTNAEGVVSTESISARVKSIFMVIIAAIKRMIVEAGKLLQRFQSLSGNLRKQLKNSQIGLRNYRSASNFDVTPTIAMTALCDANGDFSTSEALVTLRRLVEQFTWCTNVLGPETTTFISGMSKWIAGLDLSTDEKVIESFEKITQVALPKVPSDWKVSKDNSVQRGFKESLSELTFTNHVFSAIQPDVTPNTGVDFLERAVMGTVIDYDYLGNETVVANDDQVTVDSVSDINEMITLSLALLDLQDTLHGHTSQMTKELNGLMTAGQWLMTAASKAEQLDDSSVAKIVMAIQCPQNVALRVQSPFRSVLYETTRVVTGVSSLATKAKLVLDSAE